MPCTNNRERYTRGTDDAFDDGTVTRDEGSLECGYGDVLDRRLDEESRAHMWRTRMDEMLVVVHWLTRDWDRMELDGSRKRDTHDSLEMGKEGVTHEILLLVIVRPTRWL